MIHKLSELQDSVSVQGRGKGRDTHFIAGCPLCGYTHSVDVLSSDASAEALAKQNVIAHLKAQHGNEIDLDA